MNIVTEPNIAGKPIGDQPRTRPIRMLRWFIIVGLLLSLLVGGLVWFNYFRQDDRAVLRQQQTAGDQREHFGSEVRNHSQPVDRGRRSRRRASGRTSPPSLGRITDIMFTAGSHT